MLPLTLGSVWAMGHSAIPGISIGNQAKTLHSLLIKETGESGPQRLIGAKLYEEYSPDSSMDLISQTAAINGYVPDLLAPCHEFYGSPGIRQFCRSMGIQKIHHDQLTACTAVSGMFLDILGCQLKYESRVQKFPNVHALNSIFPIPACEVYHCAIYDTGELRLQEGGGNVRKKDRSY